MSERQIVLEYLKRNKLVSRYANKLGKPSRLIYEYFSRDKPCKMSDWTSLMILMSISPADLGIVKSLPIHEDYSSKVANELPIFSYSVWKNKNPRKFYKDFIQEYYPLAASYVTNAKKEILVYRYFANHDLVTENVESKVFFTGYKEYFCVFEDHLKEKVNLNPTFRYLRIMAPPLGVYSNTNENDKVSIVSKLVCYLFSETFQHIINVLNSDIGDNIQFYVLKQPRRLHSTMIIDQSVMLSEYYSMRVDGTARPDLLQIYDIQNSVQSQALINMYYDDMLKIVSEPLRNACILLNKSLLKEGIIRAQETAKENKDSKLIEILKRRQELFSQ